jgi:hypothetical protein
MDSPLQCIDGDFEHAVFATYSINLHFFESWVRPLLARCGVRNVVVFADQSQLGPALADPGLRSVGSRYHVVSTRLGPGVFHPKLIMLSGKDGVRLCVSSANMTAHGQLRNVEVAAVVDSRVEGHAGALYAAAEFLLEVARRTAPEHALEATTAALEGIEFVDQAAVRFVHNLRRPIIDEFPAGACVAVAPFVDAAGAAASRITDRGGLTLITDGREFAAPATFFDAGWRVMAYDFGEDRRLHGKSYAIESAQWLMIGSPNLSETALLRVADAGNTEAALIFAPYASVFALPSTSPWVGDLATTASTRHEVRHQRAMGEAEEGSFNAWWSDAALMVAGIADDSLIEHRVAGVWSELGRVVQGAVVATPSTSVTLVRTVDGRGRIWLARVQSPGQLQAFRGRRSGRVVGSLRRLPADMDALRELEDVFDELLALDDLVEERRRVLRERGSGPEEVGPDGISQLGDWLPARPGDEPRVPGLYREAWTKTPDSLLALIGSLMPLDDDVVLVDEAALAEETLRPDDDDDPTGVIVDPDPLPPEELPAKVVRRYRTRFIRLLERATKRVHSGSDPSLAALTFQVFVRLNFQLVGKHAVVGEYQEMLIASEQLAILRVELLEAYLNRQESIDDLTLAVAQVALADVVGSPQVWEPARRVVLDGYAYRYAGESGGHRFLAPLAGIASLSGDEVEDRLRPFAERASWEGVARYTEGLFDWAFWRTDPYPLAGGDGTIDPLDASQAWQALGYAAIAGFASGAPFGAVVISDTQTSPYARHALLVDPKRRTLWEGRQRRSDGVWYVRRYSDAGLEFVALTLRRKFYAVEGLTRTPFAPASAFPGGCGPMEQLVAVYAEQS